MCRCLRLLPVAAAERQLWSAVLAKAGMWAARPSLWPFPCSWWHTSASAAGAAADRRLSGSRLPSGDASVRCRSARNEKGGDADKCQQQYVNVRLKKRNYPSICTLLNEHSLICRGRKPALLYMVTCRSVMMECCTSSFCSCRKWKLTAFSVYERSL